MCITLDIALSASAYCLGYCLVCQCVLPCIWPCLPMYVIWDTALSGNVCYLEYCLVCPVYITWCWRCKSACITQNIVFLSVGVCTWDNSFPASVEYQVAIVYYLGYCLVCQCLLPGILPCPYLPVCITWGISSSANVYYLIDIALPASA
jgi:hypothetical protein